MWWEKFWMNLLGFDKPDCPKFMPTDPPPSSSPPPMPQCGVDLIKSFERCSLAAYLDGGGVPTNGWGNTTNVVMGTTITQEKANSDLQRNLGWAWKSVYQNVRRPLTQNQGGALLSLVYNIGEPAFLKSTLLRVVNNGVFEAVPTEIKKFNRICVNGNHVVSNGLVRRRKAEALLWTGSDWRIA